MDPRADTPRVAGHSAVKHELLVRYLDAWVAAVLHGHKRATFLCHTPSVALVDAVLRVFGEFADLLRRHPLTVMLVGPTPAPTEAASPAGLSVTRDPVIGGKAAPTGPVFGLFDGDHELLSTVATLKAGELLAFLPALRDVGCPYQCRAELVGADHAAEAMIFGTSSPKSLEKFKDELWALDEFAGIRLRDPGDETLLDISVRANVGPLRRLLAARVRAAGPQSVAELRTFTHEQTVYRAADATTAVQAMLASADFDREPSGGRLAATTIISAAAPKAAYRE